MIVELGADILVELGNLAEQRQSKSFQLSLLMARENACILIEGSADALIERKNSASNTIGKSNIIRPMNNRQLN